MEREMHKEMEMEMNEGRREFMRIMHERFISGQETAWSDYATVDRLDILDGREFWDDLEEKWFDQEGDQEGDDDTPRNGGSVHNDHDMNHDQEKYKDDDEEEEEWRVGVFW